MWLLCGDLAPEMLQNNLMTLWGFNLNYRIALIALMIILLLPLQASAGCGRWVVRENTDYLADPAFDLTTDDASIAGSAASDAEFEQENQAGAKNASDTGPSGSTSAAPAAESEPQPQDVSGSWSFSLNESRLDLILIQSGSRVQGYGNLDYRGQNQEGQNQDQKSALTAMGAVSDENLSLEVKLVSVDPDKKVDQKYSMDLAISNQTLSGVYELYLEGDMIEKGDAAATRS